MYKMIPVMEVRYIPQTPILPQNLCLLLNALGLGFLSNLIKEKMINRIQVSDVSIERAVWK